MSDWHHAQHSHNRSFAEGLDSDNVGDWVITGYFYAALHLLDQAFVEEFGSRPKRHKQRNTWAYRCAQTKDIAESYLNLKELSEHVRCEVPYHDVRSHHVTEAGQLLSEIRDHLATD